MAKSIIDISFKAQKAGFLDREAVIKAVGKARIKLLNDYGRKVRATAQKSLKYAQGPSRPGSPPNAHKTGFRKRTSKKTGKTNVRKVSYLREFLYYTYDTATNSVLIGPSKLNKVISNTALQALEKGGPSQAVRNHRLVSIDVQARPFMGPAGNAEFPAFMAKWKDSVR